MNKKLNIVIIDSNEFNRDRLPITIDIYFRKGKVTGIFESLAAAVPELEACKPDIIIIDVFTYGNQGLKFIKRQAERTFEVIIISEDDSPEKLLTALNYGAEFVFSPCEAVHLVNCLNRSDLRIEKKREMEKAVEQAKKLKQQGKSLYPEFANVYNRGIYQKVDLPDICYIEIDSPVCYLHVDDNTEIPHKYTDSRGMKYWRTLLDPEKFLKIHQTFFIRIDYYHQYTREQLVCAGNRKLTGGGGTVFLKKNNLKSIPLPVSRDEADEVKSRLRI